MNGFKTVPKELFLTKTVDTTFALFTELAAAKKIQLALSIRLAALFSWMRTKLEDHPPEPCKQRDKIHTRKRQRNHYRRTTK